MKRKKGFKERDLVLYIEDYESNSLKNMYIVKKGKKENDQYWILSETGEEKNTIEIREPFIIPYRDKYIKKYERLCAFVENWFVLKYLNQDEEKANFVKGNNTIFLILVKTTIKIIRIPFEYFLVVILYGSVKFIFGDFISYFINEHRKYTIKKKIKELAVVEALIETLNPLNSFEKEKMTLIDLKKDLNQLETTNIEINRYLIATIIAIISLYFSLTNK